jgi:hypothetical protein
MDQFVTMLATFTKAVEANDGDGLAALFTEDGVYDDGFYGAHRGRAAITAMLQRFHDEGRDYKWDFLDPLCDGSKGYSRYCFSYASRLTGHVGRPVVFRGTAFFTLRDGRIVHYSETLDSGIAMAQLDFPAERIKRALTKLANRQNAAAECSAHLARLRSLP